MLRGVYVPASLEETYDVRVACLAKAARPHTVFVDRTAAWLWGVDAYRPAERVGAVPLDAFVIRGHTRVRRPGVHGGQRELSRQDWVGVRGVRVTTPLRTAVDLACGLSRYEALAAVDALIHQHGLVRDDLQRLLPRFRGRRGVVQAREIVSVCDPRSESQGESFTRLALLDDGLPYPAIQLWVLDEHGRRRYRLDHAYEEARVAVEYDGEQHHSSAADRARDARRRTWLSERGWTVVVVTKDDLAQARREVWLGKVRSALRAHLRAA